MKIRATVCELRNSPEDFAGDWERLVAHAKAERSDLVLLPELAFAPWFALKPRFDPLVWFTSVAAHDAWMQYLPDLAPAAAIGTRPIDSDGARFNQGFLWTTDKGYIPVHEKYYLPDEDGFWEASWYGRGEREFTPFGWGAARIGMQICTELWFMEHTRAYGQAGVHLLAVPRATPRETLDKWLAGGRAAAVIAGAFTLSSNSISRPNDLANLGGQGWIIGPDGEVLGLTSPDQPFVTIDLDLAAAEHAKQTYPRDVSD
jgi:N-carbamoylputrescine amidase